MLKPGSAHSIAITPGEPAGIGPDITIKIAQQAMDFPLVAICDPQLLATRAQQLNIPLKLTPWSTRQKYAGKPAGEIFFLPVPLKANVEAGKLNKTNASYVLDTLSLATRLCIQGDVAAVVTGPVQKSIINDAGIPFSGHTEYFAEQSNTKKVVMMLATEGLRVALATTHLPLKDVPTAITKENLREVLQILIKDLNTKFAVIRPRILVCGLNPHAGEGGHLGKEEIEIISPVLQEFKSLKVDLIGPLPADTLFTPRLLEHADAVLAMYHDQGLPVLKYKGFGNAVNITLGLPFIRTSVDHGTALDLAGTGKADEGSLLTAINYAHELAQNNGD